MDLDRIECHVVEFCRMRRDYRVLCYGFKCSVMG